MSGQSNFRVVNVSIILSGETYEDYKEASKEEIIEAFKTYYNVKRKDFTIEER